MRLTHHINANLLNFSMALLLLLNDYDKSAMI
ncbi:hypothetical protein E9O_08764 [Moraxella catarrhalis 12P80B1]|nr:hypothetical protein E9O_08764 [Moraxella catarrhalis 12P80B1]